MLTTKKTEFKTILITGASSGIGEALAYEYALTANHLILMARRQNRLEDIQNKIQTQHPKCQVQIVVTDVGDYETHRRQMRNTLKDLEQIDLVIANAGIGFNTDSFKNNFENIKKTYDVNVLGAIATIEEAKDKMLKQGFGTLAGVSSVASVRGMNLNSGYSSSKAALATYLESTRVDLGSTNIHVCSIHPGFVETPMTSKNGKMPWLMSSQKAAQIIQKALQKRKARLTFPWQMWSLTWILRIMPNKLFDWISIKNDKKAREFRKDR